MLLPAKAGKQPTATASHEGSAKRTEMTCGLRWILSKSKFHKTLLLSLCYVSVAIGWVSLGHEQRPSIRQTPPYPHHAPMGLCYPSLSLSHHGLSGEHIFESAHSGDTRSGLCRRLSYGRSIYKRWLLQSKRLLT